MRRGPCEREQVLLLTRTAELSLEALITKARQDNNSEATRRLELHLALLRSAREEGISTAWDKFAASLPTGGEARNAGHNEAAHAPQGQQEGLTREQVKRAIENGAYLAELLGLAPSSPAILQMQHQLRELGAAVVLGRSEHDLPPAFTVSRTVRYQLDPPGVDKAIVAFVNAQPWEAKGAVLDREENLLVSEAALRMITRRVDKAKLQHDEELVLLLWLYRAILQRARELGATAAWAEFNALREADERIRHDGLADTVLAQTLVAWLTTPSHRERRRFLESHMELLATDSDTLLMGLIYQDAWQVEGRYRDELALFRDARERGEPVQQAISDAYVNAYGGLVLDVPDWYDELERRLDDLERGGHRAIRGQGTAQSGAATPPDPGAGFRRGHHEPGALTPHHAADPRAARRPGGARGCRGRDHASARGSGAAGADRRRPSRPRVASLTRPELGARTPAAERAYSDTGVDTVSQRTQPKTRRLLHRSPTRPLFQGGPHPPPAKRPTARELEPQRSRMSSNCLAHSSPCSPAKPGLYALACSPRRSCTSSSRRRCGTSPPATPRSPTR